MSLDAWINEIKMWNESNKGVDSLAQKYLCFIDSVRTSEDCSELKKFVEVNVVENKNIIKDKEDTITTILELIESNLGKSDLEKSTVSWNKFGNIKQEPGESTKDYVTKFEQAETGLRNV